LLRVFDVWWLLIILPAKVRPNHSRICLHLLVEEKVVCFKTKFVTLGLVIIAYLNALQTWFETSLPRLCLVLDETMV